MPEYEQNAAEVIFPDGTYEFRCVDAGEKEAQSGNVMIELQLDVFNADFTQKIRVVDRLVFTPSSYRRIDSFRRATGEKLSQNQKVSFEAEDCMDRQGRCQLKTSSYNGRNRNEVHFYIEPDEGAQPSTSTASPSASAPASQSTQPQPVQPAPKGAVPKAGQGF